MCRRLLLLTDCPDFRHLCSWKPQPDVHPDKMQRRMATVLVYHTWTPRGADTSTLHLGVMGSNGAALGTGLWAHICLNWSILSPPQPTQLSDST